MTDVLHTYHLDMHAMQDIYDSMVETLQPVMKLLLNQDVMIKTPNS
jgi:hypothetical protein